MKIAVLADIHANVAALEPVLAQIRKEGVDRVVLLGDFVGYYYEPRAVIEALAGFDCTAIRGNHDRLALEARDDDEALAAYRSQYGSGLDCVLEQFGEAEWDWLAALPETRTIDLGKYRVQLAHGASFDPDAYIYPDAPRERMARAAKHCAGDALWLGHTHWPFLSAGPPQVMNPGSVGQPRDIGGLASWAVFHADTGAVSFRRTEFAVDDLLGECRTRDPNHVRNAEQLVRGRLAGAA